MFPNDSLQEPYLCTYYVVMSLLVVFLAVSLIWCPFIHMIAEVNTVITRMVIYLYADVFGYSNAIFFNSLESAFLSDRTLSVITILCGTFVLYLASGDILNFATCYLANLPNNETLDKAKKLAFDLIEDLISITGNRKVPKMNGKFKFRTRFPKPRILKRRVSFENNPSN